jgi:hypothetical protein
MPRSNWSLMVGTSAGKRDGDGNALIFGFAVGDVKLWPAGLVASPFRVWYHDFGYERRMLGKDAL